MYTSSVGEEDQNLKSGVLSLSGTGFLGAIGRSLDLGKLIKAYSFFFFLNSNKIFGVWMNNHRRPNGFGFATSLSGFLFQVIFGS